MAKSKNFKYSLSSVILLSLVILFLALTIALYFKLKQTKDFLKGISQVIIINDFWHSNPQKLVYRGNDIILINSNFDPDSAIKVASGGPVINLQYKYVPFYKKTYFVIEEGGVEGTSDCLIFDETGKIITRHLLGNTDKSKFPSKPYRCHIDYLGDDGKLVIGFTSNDFYLYNDNNIKKPYTAVFDATSGKLKDIILK